MSRNRNKSKARQLDIGKMTFDEYQELMNLENSKPMTDQIEMELLKKGWSQKTFDQIQKDKIFPRYDGKIAAFYHEKTDSILIPCVLHGQFATVQIFKDNSIKTHLMIIEVNPNLN